MNTSDTKSIDSLRRSCSKIRHKWSFEEKLARRKIAEARLRDLLSRIRKMPNLHDSVC